MISELGSDWLWVGYPGFYYRQGQWLTLSPPRPDRRCYLPYALPIRYLQFKRPKHECTELYFHSTHMSSRHVA